MRLPTLVISIAAIAALLTSSVPAADEAYVAQAVITTGVTASAQPQTDNLTIVDYTIGSVMFYTEINGLSGEVVAHRWFYEDQEVSSITIQLSSNNSLNWSQSSITPSQLGKWEVQLVDSDGDILAVRRFDVVESGRTVNTIVQEQAVDSCSVKLAGLRTQIEEHPGVDYYGFLYEKQAIRCAEGQKEQMIRKQSENKRQLQTNE